MRFDFTAWEIIMNQDPEKLKKSVDDALDLIDVMERSKIDVPPQIKMILNSMKQGVEIGMSAQEASQYFAKFIKDMDVACGIGQGNDDDAYICLAKRDRTEGSLSYAGRVNFVLNSNNPMSAISIYWSKQKRSGWACVWDEVRNGSPTGLYRKCFIDEGDPLHLPKSAK